jgi:hypothetical protein
MTDPIQTEADKPPGPPEDEPTHGIVEEIKEGIEHVKEEIQEDIEHVKEGIEHVVEHVPKPVRWTVKRLFWAAMLSLAALVVLLVLTAILYVANRTEWAAKELTVIINQTLARRSDVELEIRDIKGNPLNGVRLLDASVRFREGDQPPLLVAQVIRLNYSAIGLLRGSSPIVLELEQPVVRLAKGPDGKLRLPRWKAEPRGITGRPSRGFDVRLRIANGSVRLPRPLEGVEGLTLEARAQTGGHSSATIERMSWTRGPYGSVLQSLRGEITEGDSVRCLIRELRTGDVELRGKAAWARGAGQRLVALDVARVRWAWLARVFKNNVFDVPGEGKVLVHAAGRERWSGDFAGVFDWDGLAIDGHGRFDGGSGGWTVEPLSGRSKAGDLEGRFVYSSTAWEVGGDVRHGQPARWAVLHIPGWPSGDLNGRFRYAVAAKGPDQLDARLVSSQLAGWRADSARVTMSFPEGRPDTFRVETFRRGGGMTLLGVTAPDGWHGRYQIAGLPLDEWPDGRASGIRGQLVRGEGTVEGRSGELYVGGALEGATTDWFGARIERWRMEEIEGRLLPTPDLAFRSALGNVTFLGIHFDSAAAGLRLGDRAMGIATLAAHAGDTLFTASGRAAWSPDHWNLTFDRAAAKSAQFDWTADPPVTLAGDARGVSFERLAMRDGDARMNISGRWGAPPSGSYSFRAHGEHLDLGRLGLPLEWGLEGRSDATLIVDGPSGSPRWTFDAVARQPGARGHRSDSLVLALSGGRGELEVRRLDLKVGEGSLEAHGRVERTSQPWPDTLTAEGVQAWLADAARWEGTVRTVAFPLDRVQALSPAAGEWGGRLDATLAVGGSPGQPRLELSAEARPISWRDYHVDHAAVRAEFHDGRLAVEQIQVSRGGVESSASGGMALRLRLGSPPEVPDAPMTWKLDIPSGDLAVVPLFVPQIGSASGHFDLSAAVTGTARRPLLSGSGRVRGGVVRLAAREEELRGLDADFRLDPTGVHLESLTASQGDRGRLTGKGDVKLKGLAIDGYRFDLSLRDFAAVETGSYAAEFDGDFVVTNGPRVRGTVLPQVTGTVESRHAVVLIDFTNQTETEQLAATTQELFWTYRVQVSATSNLHWQPPGGDIEFSADLTVEQTRDSLMVYGDMRALRGTYFFLSNRFDVTRADLTFDNLSGVNPVLDVEAGTRVKQPVGRTDCPTKGGAEDITATITGRANEPVVAFTSSPNSWGENCILQELTVGRFQNDKNAFNPQDPLDSYLTQAINRTLSAEMSRAFNGYVNEWVLERERGGLLTGEGDLIVGVGFPVSRNLQVRYRQRVPGMEREYGGTGKPTDPFERDVEAEYRLNRFFYISTELKQRRILTGSTGSVVGTPDFNVNLKARWEY